MGGDFGPHVVVPGAVAAARREKCDIVLVGDLTRIEDELSRLDTRGLGVRLVHAPTVAGMTEKPSEALRRKKDSSIQIAANLVRDGEADGLVSAGNTGTTAATGMFTIGRMEGVERPGLAAFLPTEKKPFVAVDVGANVDCRASHLMQFAVMGDVLAKNILGRAAPRVGLLSIGEEEGKGNALTKEAFDLIRRTNLHFVGNVEGRDVFTGDYDVIICDGFVGNVMLKLTEGLASSLGRLLKGALRRGFFAKIGATLALGALKRFSRLVDYADVGGAPLLGLKEIVIVCHGASNVRAIASATAMAATYVRKDAKTKLAEGIAANREHMKAAKPKGSNQAA